MTSPFTVGIIQDHAGLDSAANLARAERLVREAAGRGAQIICLKELFNSLYFCKSQQCDRFDLAEPIPGPTTEAMQKLARELAVVLVVPLFERQAAGVYRNSAAIIDADGTLLGVYRKMHLVPFGEYVPLKKLFFFAAPLVEAVSDLPLIVVVVWYCW